jgi:hypothetical protein
LLAVLAAVVVAALWRFRTAALGGLVFLAVTVPVLGAARFGPQHAITPALCWGLAGCFIAASALVWMRVPLAEMGVRLGMPIDPDSELAPRIRAMLIALCVVPILALTWCAVAVPLVGEALLKPAPGTFFATLSALGRFGIPLIVVAAALVGHALRERSAGYAFAAGLLVDMVVMGGQALHAVTTRHAFTTADGVQVVQLGSIAAALWAIAWMVTRRWLVTWREDSVQVWRRSLM